MRRDLFVLRSDWTIADIADLFERPFMDLLFVAQTVHRYFHDPNKVEFATLLSIKTGGCPEDCRYCSQSVTADTGLRAEKLMSVEVVVARAREARCAGATRFCMGAAWRNARDRDLDALCEMVSAVKALGLQTCMTLGMLTEKQAERLAGAGLDFYNHNIDTSREYYGQVITTRTFEDRLNALRSVRAAGIAICCGGILGMGESREDRVSFLHTLATLPQHPESVPINALVPIRGTALGDRLSQSANDPIDDIEFVRTVAVARLLMPASVIRLSAGRAAMPDATQALCFLAGANSLFLGEKLLTTGNPSVNSDAVLLAKLGLEAASAP